MLGPGVKTLGLFFIRKCHHRHKILFVSNSFGVITFSFFTSSLQKYPNPGGYMSGKLVQLDLFVSQREQLRELEQDEFKKIITKSIRGLFARNNDVEYALLEMNRRLDRVIEAVFKNE